MNLVGEVKKKKGFSGLPDSVVERALMESEDDVKETRSLLRKYFGVFLIWKLNTNHKLMRKKIFWEPDKQNEDNEFDSHYQTLFVMEVYSFCDMEDT